MTVILTSQNDNLCTVNRTIRCTLLSIRTTKQVASEPCPEGWTQLQLNWVR